MGLFELLNLVVDAVDLSSLEAIMSLTSYWLTCNIIWYTHGWRSGDAQTINRLAACSLYSWQVGCGDWRTLIFLQFSMNLSIIYNISFCTILIKSFSLNFKDLFHGNHDSPTITTEWNRVGLMLKATCQRLENLIHTDEKRKSLNWLIPTSTSLIKLIITMMNINCLLIHLLISNWLDFF